MKIAAHMTFWQDNDKCIRDERTAYATAAIRSLATIDGMTVFVHSNFDYKADPDISCVSVVRHNMRHDHPFNLCTKSRQMMADTRNDYDYTMYIEDDIEFSAVNMGYHLKYHDNAAELGFMLGNIRVETRDGSPVFTDIVSPIHNFLDVPEVSESFGDARVFRNTADYQAFWILSKDEMCRFIDSHSDSFFLKTPRRPRDIRASAAYGPIGVLYSKQLYVDAPGLLVHHIPDTYARRESTIFARMPIAGLIRNDTYPRV